MPAAGQRFSRAAYQGGLPSGNRLDKPCGPVFMDAIQRRKAKSMPCLSVCRNILEPDSDITAADHANVSGWTDMKGIFPQLAFLLCQQFHGTLNGLALHRAAANCAPQAPFPAHQHL